MERHPDVSRPNDSPEAQQDAATKQILKEYLSALKTFDITDKHKVKQLKGRLDVLQNIVNRLLTKVAAVKSGKKEFLFLFDYGDEWRFGVKLLGIKDKLPPDAEYPRITAARGDAPLQYPPWDDDEEWDDEEEGDEDDTPMTGTILHFDPKTGIVTRETIDIPPKNKS